MLGGVDGRAYISRDWYVGIDPGAGGWNNWYVITGDAYTGYDFSKNWGVRLGYDANFVHSSNDVNSYNVDALLGAAYVQVVWGF